MTKKTLTNFDMSGNIYADNYIVKLYKTFKGGCPVNKTELISAVAEKAACTKKEADAAISAIINVIGDALKKGDKVQLVGFGTFETRKRAARKGLNPRTKETIDIPASTVPVFKAGKALKDSIK